MPPTESHVPVQCAENQPGYGQYHKYDAGKHRKMESERFASDLIYVSKGERIVYQTEKKEKERQQHDIYQLRSIAFGEPQDSVHFPII